MDYTTTYDNLSAKVGTAMQAAFNAHQADVLAPLPWLVRAGAPLWWPVVAAWIPTLAAIAIDTVSAVFGAMKVNDLLQFLNQNATATATHGAGGCPSPTR
jgi:hypothetical protein